jgi:hypothetical protein
MKRLLSASFLFVFLSASLFAQEKNVQRWDYLHISTCDSNLLNKYGDDGWELAGVTRYDSNNCEQFTFKRPKPANAPKYIEPANQKVIEEKAKPTCQLTLAQAPKFRGIRLGMSIKEMLSLFPGSEQSNYVISALQQISKNYGVGEFRFGFEQYGRTKETASLFDGIQLYSFEVLDDRIVSYSVMFSEYRKELDWQWTADSWQEKLTEVFNLPVAENWGKKNTFNKGQSGGGSMLCNGFEIWSDSNSKSASFTIKERLQPQLFELILQRREAAADKVRQSFKIIP